MHSNVKKEEKLFSQLFVSDKLFRLNLPQILRDLSPTPRSITPEPPGPLPSTLGSLGSFEVVESRERDKVFQNTSIVTTNLFGRVVSEPYSSGFSE